MASQDSESLLKKNNQQKKYWAILGKGSISHLLLKIMINEGFKKEYFKGFLVTAKDSSNNLSLKIYSYNSELLSDQIVKNEINDFSEVSIYCSIGYSNMNKSREFACETLNRFLPKSQIKSFISKEAYIGKDVIIEDGCLILPKSIIEPTVKIKKGSVIWFGSQVCHHTIIYPYSWIAAASVIGAKCLIGERTFIAVGGIVPSGTNLAKGTLITAGSVSPKTTNENQVVDRKYFSNENKFKDFNSDDFIRFL